MKISLITLMIILSSLQAFTQNQRNFTVMFYNVENLFDTIDDPKTDDKDFLPGSNVSWNSRRYYKKIDKISKVIIAADPVNFPAIIGIAEAENKNVLKDLISGTDLKKKKYDIILEEGPDPRGIDVGLIYKKDMFRVISSKPYRGADSFDGRYILYVKLKYAKDTLHLFVNHWKSRQGGESETAPMRMESARKLKSITDSLLTRNPSSNIIIMGDFNDEPLNASISVGLMALPPEKEVKKNALYDLMFGPFRRDEGTLYYKDWDLFDQIIVSGNMLDRKTKGPKTGAEASILKKDWMLYRNKQGVMVPDRTAGSREYFGGVSDHLPVYTEITY